MTPTPSATLRRILPSANDLSVALGMFSIENGLQLWVIGFSVKVTGDFMFASAKSVLIS
jgi:hypothetical protein